MTSKAIHRSLEAKLAALKGPEWDSSDEEDDVPVASSKSEKTMKQSSSGKKSGDRGTKQDEKQASSVIYIGHLPAAFEEYELKSFLTQFGDVANVRVARSKKTSNPKGYAFCEFADPQVATIVAETMSGYFLMDKRLVCHVLPQDKVHPRMFHGKQWKKIDWRGLHRQQVNKPKSAERMKKITARLITREKQKREKLKDIGIDYEFPGYEAAGATLKEETQKVRKVSSSDLNVESESGNKKRRKMSSDETKTAKAPKSSKKERQNSDASLKDEAAETSSKAPISNRTAQTEKKPKKKKSVKKRRESSA